MMSLETGKYSKRLISIYEERVSTSLEHETNPDSISKENGGSTCSDSTTTGLVTPANTSSLGVIIVSSPRAGIS